MWITGWTYTAVTDLDEKALAAVVRENVLRSVHHHPKDASVFWVSAALVVAWNVVPDQAIQR